ncbi:MAG: hypothetical protein HZB16_03115 [Armatimonadetes bacterium]|nr:hypothetical protein [Armatimonadota bacterium]
MAANTDRAWEQFVDHNKLVLDGRPHRVEADLLRRQTGCEPRLVARYESPDELPRCLREAGYTILPLRLGEYLLTRGNLCCEVPVIGRTEPQLTALPFTLETAARGEGESQYIDHAYNTGLLQRFVGASPLFLTIRGRERTGAFSFQLGEVTVDVEGAQIEVDAGYEGEREIILVEAKIGRRAHLNVRQIYYPWRHFGQLLPHKTVRPLLLTYDVATTRYELHEFCFDQVDDPTSWRVLRSAAYRLYEPERRRLDELTDGSRPVRSVVPQADDFNRLVRFLEVLESGLDQPRAVAAEVGFTERQAGYYREAAEYLALVQPGSYWPSPRGRDLLRAAPNRRRELLARAVVNSWVLRDLVARGDMITDQAISEVISALTWPDGRPRYSGQTVERRARTIRTWLGWLAEEVGCFRRAGDGWAAG